MNEAVAIGVLPGLFGFLKGETHGRRSEALKQLHEVFMGAPYSYSIPYIIWSALITGAVLSAPYALVIKGAERVIDYDAEYDFLETWCIAWVSYVLLYTLAALAERAATQRR